MYDTSRLRNIAFLGLLVSLCRFSDEGFGHVGAAEQIVDTDPHVVLEVGTRGILPCRIQRPGYSVEWKRQLSAETELLVSLDLLFDVGERDGPGFEAGLFNITDDYSLVIKDVKVQDEGLFMCSFIDYKTGKVFRNSTIVFVQAFPDEPFPTIQECIAKDVNPGACTLTVNSTSILTCHVKGYYPDIDLSFMHGSEKVTPTEYEEWKNADGTKNKNIRVQVSISDKPYQCVASGLAGIVGNRSVSVIVQSRLETQRSQGPNAVAIVVPVTVLVVICLIIAGSYKFGLGKSRGLRSARGFELVHSEMPVEEILRSHLEGHYKSHIKMQIRPWTYNDTRHFDHQYISPVICTERTPHESTDNILMEDFSGIRSKRIVCVGRPGIGKSTVLNKLALDWASKKEESTLREVSSLFFLNMGIMKDNPSIGNAIANQLLIGRKYSEQIIEEYIEANQKKCAILFDGYDESKFGVDDENETSQILRGEKYPDCLVIVTTRPNREQDFSARIDMARMYISVQIEGFDEDRSKEYIKNYFCNDETSGNILQEYLKSDLVLRSLTAIPFLCMVVCVLWEVDMLAGVNSQTDLFNKLNQYIFSRFEYEHRPTVPEDMHHRNISDTAYLSIGKVSMESLKRNSRVAYLREEDCRKASVIKHIRKACSVGMIHKTTIPLNDTSETQTLTLYHFYHELALKHCASVYLTHKIDTLQDFLNSTITSKGKTLEYEMLLRFACGSSTESCIKIMEHVLKQWNRKGRSKLHRILLGFLAEHQRETASDRTVDCMMTCIEDGTLHLENISNQAILGLKKLPEASSTKITTLNLRNFFLPTTVTEAMLKRLKHLQEVRMDWSEFPEVSPLASVTQISIDNMKQQQAYSNALRFVPYATTVNIGVGVNRRDDVVYAIASGIQLAALSPAVEWKEMTIDGSAGLDMVSSTTGKKFADMVANHLIHLQLLELCRVDMEEAALAAIVDKCREISSMRELIIGLCRSRVDGALDTHLMQNSDQEGGITVTVYHSMEYGGKTARKYCMKHV